MESTNSKKNLVIMLFAAAFLCASCKEKTSETLLIFIQNRTDSAVHVTLYPKSLLGKNGLYNKWEGFGGVKSNEYILFSFYDSVHSSRGDEMIFAARDLTLKPYELALREFDSIYIRTAYNLIIFTPENVTGYAENIFSENSTWDFEIYEDDLIKSSYKYYIENRYTFRILNEKIIINQ